MHQVASRVNHTHMDTGPTDLEISDAYLYLLGRLLVLRQEQVDFRFEGFRWNHVHHREPDSVTLPNPDLDIVCSEAWIAVDDRSCTILSLPEIHGRYYTVQIVNGWGETIANINDRTRPQSTPGDYALCLAGSRAPVPAGAMRIDLPARKARCVIRIETGADPAMAAALQRQIKLHAYGEPSVPPTLATPLFTNDGLPGPEAFEQVEQVLASERDLIPEASVLQSKARAAAALLRRGGREHSRIGAVIEQIAWRRLARRLANLGLRGHGWIRPKIAGRYESDWLTRTATGLSRPWANEISEVVYFTAGTDQPLDGGRNYTLTFAPGELPCSHVRYFWSMTAVDAADRRVMPNAGNRFLLTTHSGLSLDRDGSLTLYLGPSPPPSAPEANWLPTASGRNYLLMWRSFGPDALTRDGAWFPPSVVWPGAPHTAA